MQLELKLKVNTDELVRIWKGYYKPISLGEDEDIYENRQSLHP
jgi:hypothetical protein